MSIVGIVFALIVIGVILYLINTLLPIDHKFKTLINVVVVLAAVLWLADVMFGYSPRYDGCATRPVHVR